MATPTVSVHIRGSERILARMDDGSISIGLHPDLEDEPTGTDVTIFLPHNDDDATLALEILEAAIDNAKSYVELRRTNRIRDGLR